MDKKEITDINKNKPDEAENINQEVQKQLIIQKGRLYKALDDRDQLQNKLEVIKTQIEEANITIDDSRSIIAGLEFVVNLKNDRPKDN